MNCKDCGEEHQEPGKRFCEACRVEHRREAWRKSNKKRRSADIPKVTGIKFYVRSNALANLAVAMIESCKGEDCDDCLVSFFCPGGGNGYGVSTAQDDYQCVG